MKQEEQKNQNGNQVRKVEPTLPPWAELKKIKKELGEKGGAGHVFAKRDARDEFDEEAVRKVLRGLEAGLTQVNFLERDRIAFYFCFSFRRDFHPNQSFFVIKTWKFEKAAGTSDNKRGAQATAEMEYIGK